MIIVKGSQGDSRSFYNSCEHCNRSRLRWDFENASSYERISIHEFRPCTDHEMISLIDESSKEERVKIINLLSHRPDYRSLAVEKHVLFNYYSEVPKYWRDESNFMACLMMKSNSDMPYMIDCTNDHNWRMYELILNRTPITKISHNYYIVRRDKFKMYKKMLRKLQKSFKKIQEV